MLQFELNQAKMEYVSNMSHDVIKVTQLWSQLASTREREIVLTLKHMSERPSLNMDLTRLKMVLIYTVVCILYH